MMTTSSAAVHAGLLLINNGEMMSAVARGLGAAVSRDPFLRPLLRDLVCDVDPASPCSSLGSISEFERARRRAELRVRLRDVLIGVSRVADGETAGILTELACAVAEPWAGPGPDRRLERWIRVSLRAGVRPADFLQIFG